MRIMASERILIVDDEDGMRRLLSRVLTREGYDTSAVGSGAEALRMVATERFDLAVTDIKMPEMDGLQLLAELKEYEGALKRVKEAISIAPNEWMFYRNLQMIYASSGKPDQFEKAQQHLIPDP